jgi:uncharacterized phage protein (TIGR02218 family)
VKTLPAGLQAHLDSGTTTLAWCWRLARADGIVMGFTDHDADLAFDGVTYKAASGFTASEIQSQLGLAIDNLTAMGALSSAAIKEDDLAAKLYDDAAIEIWRVNWADTGQRVLMRKGNLGEITRGKTAFQAEVRGLAHRLGETVGRAFLRICDADLGDARCTIDLTNPAFNGAGAVVGILTARRVFTASGLSGFASGWFNGGKLTFASGANDGHAMEIKAHGKSGSVVTVELWEPMGADIAAADSFAITAGCDKTQGTCAAKFSNIANFRGFPFMPGNDAVIAYPNRADGNLDGGSRNGN